MKSGKKNSFPGKEEQFFFPLIFEKIPSSGRRHIFFVRFPRRFPAREAMNGIPERNVSSESDVGEV